MDALRIFAIVFAPVGFAAAMWIWYKVGAFGKAVTADDSEETRTD